MTIARAIYDKKTYSARIHKVIAAFLFAVVFKEIMAIIEPIEEYYNAADPLAEAIRAHRIQCIHGVPTSKFYGSFDAKTSQRLRELGAKWNKRTGTFDVERNLIPINILDAIAFASLYQTAMRKSVIQALKSISIEQSMPQLNKLLQVPLDEILEDLHKQAIHTLQQYVTVKIQASDPLREQLKSAYINDVSKSVKAFAENEVIKLRRIVEKNLFEGLENNESLVLALQREFNLKDNRARFLARNETGTLVSTYRMAQYKAMGITHYRWQTSKDERVRDHHKIVDGRIFSWDSPPVETGFKHPGQDFQCRCVARPIIQ